MYRTGITEEEAKKLYGSKFWEALSYEDRAKFQLFEPLLCMPFKIFHEAVEKTLGRPVYTHEFGYNIEGLRKEIMGEAESLTLEEIINLIPKDKFTIIVYSEDKNGK